MDLLTPPSWAVNYCYLYFAGALMVIGVILLALITGYKKMNGFAVVALLLSGALAFMDAIMYFWICRASLAK
jgi:hypothetical protein